MYDNINSFQGLPTGQPNTNLLRPYRKIVRALNPEESVQKVEEAVLLEAETILVFRVKRDAELDPFEVLALEGLDLPPKAKKVQKDFVSEIAKTMNLLTINDNKENKQENKQEEEYQEILTAKKEVNNEPLQGLLFTDDPEDNKTLILKRIDASSIFDEKNEEDFSKNYKTVYNEEIRERKRDETLQEKRKKMMENFEKEKKFKIYDVQINKEKVEGKDVLHCNGKPMVVTNLLKLALNKEVKDFDEEEEKDGYHYYMLRKAATHEAHGAQKIGVDEAMRGVVSSHLAEEDLVDDGKPDSEAAYNKDVDNVDSNSEDNPNYDYPDEEDSRGQGSEDEDDYYGGYGGEYGDEEDDDGDEFTNNESVFKRNFYNKINEMNEEEDSFEWPGNK